MKRWYQVHGSEIENASIADASNVAALWRDCGLTRPWNDPDADFTLALAEPSSTILVVRGDEGIDGSVMVGFDGHRGWVYYLAVSPGQRRTGLGRALMEAAEAWLRARGAPKIQLMIREDNAEALGFYKSLGLERQKVAVFGRFLEEDA
jgi:ribosomal protein S18 acetylase RimI-like enzyme